MPGGNLNDYISQNPDADRIGLVSPSSPAFGEVLIPTSWKASSRVFTISIPATSFTGISREYAPIELRYVVVLMSSQSNVLVDDTGRPRIGDFGFATVARDLDSTWNNTPGHGHATRWTAPEVLTGMGGNSKGADVFSFAMVMIEVIFRRLTTCQGVAYLLTFTQVFTGAVPFNDSPLAAAISGIIDGRRPSRPNHSNFTDDVWVLMQRCWDQDPHMRPEVSEVSEVLRVMGSS